LLKLLGDDPVLTEKRLKIITGHYGSGKTEFAINYALNIAKESSSKIAIVDLDIVNPYFRAREAEHILHSKGIRVIGASVKGASLDIPAVSSEVLTIFHDKSYIAVLDVGGDQAGARILGRYHDNLAVAEYDMFFVLNANRPLTNTPQAAIRHMRAIEEGSRQKITALVNNTHLCESTTIDDVFRGQELSENVSDQTGLPIRYTVVEEKLAEKIVGKIKNEILPINIYMKKPWED